MITRDMLVQLVLAMTLCIIATVQPLLMEFVKRGNGGHTPFHTPSAVFYTEAIKLVVALCIWGYQARTLEYTGLENFRLSTAVVFAVPAALFALQNNAVFFAMQVRRTTTACTLHACACARALHGHFTCTACLPTHALCASQLLDPPTFQLWACFKLIPVGLASRAVLGKRLSPVQWAALALLALGMANTTLDCAAELSAAASGGAAASRRAKGIVILLVQRPPLLPLAPTLAPTLALPLPLPMPLTLAPNPSPRPNPNPSDSSSPGPSPSPNPHQVNGCTPHAPRPTPQPPAPAPAPALTRSTAASPASQLSSTSGSSSSKTPRRLSCSTALPPTLHPDPSP